MTTANDIETIVRSHYGRLLAYLAAGFRDVTAAEDALQASLVAALERWPLEGVPRRPDSWLFAASRRKILDQLRRGKVARDFAEDVRHRLSDASEMDQPVVFPDERLKLMFVCAHPAIEPSAHAPLMLQTVLGLNAKKIADAFVLSPATMSQRLVRTKAKIAAAGIPFIVPEPEDLPRRLGAVLDAIYAAYTSGWTAYEGGEAGSLVGEAMYLVQLSVNLSGRNAEALGLYALICYSEARALARFDRTGAYIPLYSQDVQTWHRAKIATGEAALREASRQGTLGRFQLEAAIQSAHIDARINGRDAVAVIVPLYHTLIKLFPSFGACTGLAAALSLAGDYKAALEWGDHIPEAHRQIFQPYWAVRADALAGLGDLPGAAHAFDIAEGLSNHPAVKAYLRGRRSALV